MFEFVKRSCKFFIFGFFLVLFSFVVFYWSFEFGLLRDGFFYKLMNLGIWRFFLYLYCGSLVFTQAFSLLGVLGVFSWSFFSSEYIWFMGFVLKMLFKIIWAIIDQFIWIHLREGDTGNWGFSNKLFVISMARVLMHTVESCLLVFMFCPSSE